jgi:hypothetical protein
LIDDRFSTYDVYSTESDCSPLAGCHRKRVLVDGYPCLVLQLSNAAAGLPLLRIKMAEVVAHFSYRPECNRSARSEERPAVVLCHHDVRMASQNHDMAWQHFLSKTNVRMAEPIRDRCFSKMCCSPLCLVYATQSYNAQTGRTREQQQTRQARGGKAQPKGDA